VSDDSLSALPSRTARAIAFTSIVIAGTAGGVLGFGIVDLQCTTSCAVPQGIGILTGSLFVAGGTAIVCVLVLRALGEWREISDRS